MDSNAFSYFIKICLIFIFAVIIYFVLLYMEVFPKYEGKDNFVNIEENIVDNQTSENIVIQNEVENISEYILNEEY